MTNVFEGGGADRALQRGTYSARRYAKTDERLKGKEPGAGDAQRTPCGWQLQFASRALSPGGGQRVR